MQDMSILEGRHKLVVGGGIGSGKSVVTSRLAERGAVVIESDAIGHSVIAVGGRAFNDVATRWPDAVADGAIDRAALADIVFSDPASLAELEALTHPHIAAEIQARTVAAGDAPVVVEVPILAAIVDTAWTRVWIAADLDVRIRRAVARGMSDGDARRRAFLQPSDDAWATWADFVVINEGSEMNLVGAVEALLRRLSILD